MHLIDLFRTGIYFYSLPYHLIFILLGLFIRILLKTPRARWCWLGAEIITLILCEFGCASTDVVTIIASYVLYILAFDLLVGHGIIGIINGFRHLVDWLNKSEENSA